MILRIFLLLLLGSSCATRVDYQKEYALGDAALIEDVPFIPQEKYQCGPAALGMLLRYRGKTPDQKELTAQVYTPGKKGSIQSDVTSGARRQGMLALPVSKMPELLREVQDGNPVLVLQNLGLSWYPRWHYAVVIGFDLEASELILHSGETDALSMDLSTFERTWARAKNWGLLVVNPGYLPSTATELDLVKASAHLEQQRYLTAAARSYRAILRKWPESLGAHVGLGNVNYQQDKLEAAAAILKEATRLHPRDPSVWNNYSVVLSELGRGRESQRALLKSEKLSGKN